MSPAPAPTAPHHRRYELCVSDTPLLLLLLLLLSYLIFDGIQIYPFLCFTLAETKHKGKIKGKIIVIKK